MAIVGRDSIHLIYKMVDRSRPGFTSMRRNMRGALETSGKLARNLAQIAGRGTLRGIRNVGRALGGAFSTLAGGFGTLAGGGAIATLTALTVKGNEVAEAYERYGLALNGTNEQIQRITSTSRTNLEDTLEALKNLRERVGEGAVEPDGGIAEAFAGIGIDNTELQRLAGADLETVFLRYAEAIRGAETNSEALFRNMELLGEEGFRTLSTMAVGAENLTREMDLLDEAFGTVVDDENFDAIREYRGALGLAQKVFRSLSVEVAGVFAPIIRGAIVDVLAFIKANGGVGEVVSRAFNVAGRAVDAVRGAINLVGDSIGGFGTAAASVAAGVASAWGFVTRSIARVNQVITAAIVGTNEGIAKVRQLAAFAANPIDGESRRAALAEIEADRAAFVELGRQRFNELQDTVESSRTAGDRILESYAGIVDRGRAIAGDVDAQLRVLNTTTERRLAELNEGLANAIRDGAGDAVEDGLRAQIEEIQRRAAQEREEIELQPPGFTFDLEAARGEVEVLLEELAANTAAATERVGGALGGGSAAGGSAERERRLAEFENEKTQITENRAALAEALANGDEAIRGTTASAREAADELARSNEVIASSLQGLRAFSSDLPTLAGQYAEFRAELEDTREQITLRADLDEVSQLRALAQAEQLAEQVNARLVADFEIRFDPAAVANLTNAASGATELANGLGLLGELYAQELPELTPGDVSVRELFDIPDPGTQSARARAAAVATREGLESALGTAEQIGFRVDLTGLEPAQLKQARAGLEDVREFFDEQVRKLAVNVTIDEQSRAQALERLAEVRREQERLVVAATGAGVEGGTVTQALDSQQAAADLSSLENFDTSKFTEIRGGLESIRLFLSEGFGAETATRQLSAGLDEINRRFRTEFRQIQIDPTIPPEQKAELIAEAIELRKAAEENLRTDVEMTITARIEGVQQGLGAAGNVLGAIDTIQRSNLEAGQESLRARSEEITAVRADLQAAIAAGDQGEIQAQQAKLQALEGLQRREVAIHRKRFEQNKKIQRAIAIVNTIAAAVEVYRSTPGEFFIKAAAMAATLASGYAQVRAINATKFDSGVAARGAAGGGGGATGSGGGGTGPISTDSVTNLNAANSSRRTTAVITIERGLYSDQMVADILEEAAEAIGDGLDFRTTVAA
jgi:hypothetical protein